MSFQSNEVASVLENKGFVLINDKHHLKYCYQLDGVDTQICTYVSFGRNEITPYVLSQMAKQLKLTLSDTKLLFQCPLTKEKLHEIYDLLING